MISTVGGLRPYAVREIAGEYFYLCLNLYEYFYVVFLVMNQGFEALFFHLIQLDLTCDHAIRFQFTCHIHQDLIIKTFF